MTLAKRIGEGEILPSFLGLRSWYAVAYRDWDIDKSVCYPIPLHIVVRLYRDFAFWVREVWRPSYREQVEMTAFRKGWHTGWEVGVGVGRREGAEGLRAELLAQFDAKYGTKPE